MHELFKYLYTLSAACFIAVGSGVIAVVPYVVDYEGKAMRAGYDLEQAAGLDYFLGIDCKEIPKLHAD